MQAMTDDLEHWQDFAVEARTEILTLLRRIHADGQPLRLLEKADAESPLAALRLLDIGTATLLLQCPTERASTEALLATPGLLCETTLDNIRVLFAATGLRKTRTDSGPAFCADLPHTLYRLQRREFYRIPAPPSKPLRATIALSRDTESSVSFSLHDISCGGISLIDHESRLDTTVGQVYEACEIELPEIGLVNTSLQVRNCLDTARPHHGARRLGCQFTGISHAALASVQRYILRTESARNARLAGFR